MKKTNEARYAILALSVVILSGSVLADSSNAGICYSVTDPDYRALCRAKAHHQPGYCYSIQRQDIRAQCLADVRSL